MLIIIFLIFFFFSSHQTTPEKQKISYRRNTISQAKPSMYILFLISSLAEVALLCTYIAWLSLLFVGCELCDMEEEEEEEEEAGIFMGSQIK